MSILQNITNKIGNRSRSGDWFRTQLMEELDNDPNLNFNDMDTGGFSPGNLYQYTYNATTEQPYYDMYPLTYVIEMQPGGFLGCNLHYVKLKRRDDLAISLLNNSAQGAVAVPRNTLHRYLYTGVRGVPYRIPETEWSDVAQLPTEKFVEMRGIVIPKHKVYTKN